MVIKKGHEHRKHLPLNAKCVNLMAQFIRLSNNAEGHTLRLQDRDILQKMSLIAHATSDQRLVDLHNELRIEMRKQNELKTPVKDKNSSFNEKIIAQTNKLIDRFIDQH